MKKVTTREAQHHLSRVLAMVEQGEEVVITRRGRGIAKLSVFHDEQKDGSVIVPDFAAIRKDLGTDRLKGENEVLKQRNSST